MFSWADHNQHDPGITLVQLLPWLAVALTFAIGMRAYRGRRRRKPVL